MVFVRGETRSLLFPRSLQVLPMNRFVELPASASSIRSLFRSEALKFLYIEGSCEDPISSSLSESKICFLDYDFPLSISFFSDIKGALSHRRSLLTVNFKFKPGIIM